MEISQNFLTFSEYMNFNKIHFFTFLVGLDPNFFPIRILIVPNVFMNIFYFFSSKPSMAADPSEDSNSPLSDENQSPDSENDPSNQMDFQVK